MQRPHLRDESFGASTRGLVQFYRDSKEKAEKAKAFHAQEPKEERPPEPVKNEESDDNAENISNVAVVKVPTKEEGLNGNAYIKEENIVRRFDLNEVPSPNTSGKYIHTGNDNDNFLPESSTEHQGAGKVLYTRRIPMLLCWA